MSEASLELFARDDKWALGAGDGALFAPRFPLWLDAPGFWDEATLHQYALSPLYTVSILDDQGAELPMTVAARRWTPAELLVEYRLPGGITAIETRTVQPGGVFASEWSLRSPRPCTLHLVGWTMQDPALAEGVTWNGALGLRRTLVDRWNVPLDVQLELACGIGATSWGALVADRGPWHPHWRLTPFPVLWGVDGLPRAVVEAPTVAGGRDERALFAAVHRAVEVNGDTAAATFALRVVAADPALRTRPADGRRDEDEGDRRRAKPTPAAPLVAATLARASRQRWADWLSRTPRVRTDDPYLETWMRHRWAGIRLMTTGTGAGEYARPLVAQGPADCHLPTPASAAQLARDLRWLRDPPLARAAVRGWLERVRPDGSLPRLVALQHAPDESSHSTAFGEAFVAVAASVPDAPWVTGLLPAFGLHARWLERRAMRFLEAEGDALPVAYDAPGAGVTAVADALGALDALWRLGTEARQSLGKRRKRLAKLAVARYWDPARGLFHDGRTPAVAGLLLYPWLDAVDPELRALEQAVTDPMLFGTPYPLPTLAGTEAGTHVDPMLACRVADAVARTVVARDVARLRPLVGRLVRRVVHTFFPAGDLRRPGSFEHYDPLRGHPSAHRGRDDVQRSASADLVLQWIAGIRPHATGITIDPLPAGIAAFSVENLRVRGREVAVRIEDERVVATVDGVAHESTIGKVMEIADG